MLLAYYNDGISFTYSVADLWCMADLSGIDKGTGAGSVRNVVGTLPC